MPASPSSFQNRRMSSQSVVASPARQPSPSFEEDDLILIRRVAEKDRQAFEILYQRYALRLHRYLSKLIRQRALIEEVLDDVMLVVWQNAAHFNQTSRISTWMFGIAYHKALKAFAWPANHSREVPPAMPDQGIDREVPEGAMARQDQAHLQVVFADEMTAQELRALLTSIGRTIVKGPSALGVYTVEILVSGGSPDLVNPILDAVRAHPKVRLAEPIPSR
jgi:DNA-directed RNA polymerase specialized sigma24 family protein